MSVSLEVVRRILGKPSGIRRDMVMDQDAVDIINGMLRAHRKWARQYDKIYKLFIGDNIEDICYGLWKFIKQIPYRVETENLQTVKSPQAIVWYNDVPGGIDCKHYSLFIAGVLDAMRRNGIKIKWAYRFVSYKNGDDTPHHVFVVVWDNDGREIWIDGVLNGFDVKKGYYWFIDYKYNSMLSSISGLGDTTMYLNTQNQSAQNTCYPTITQSSSPETAFGVQGCPVTITASKDRSVSDWWASLNNTERWLLIILGGIVVYKLLK